MQMKQRQRQRQQHEWTRSANGSPTTTRDQCSMCSSSHQPQPQRGCEPASSLLLYYAHESPSKEKQLTLDTPQSSPTPQGARATMATATPLLPSQLLGGSVLQQWQIGLLALLPVLVVSYLLTSRSRNRSRSGKDEAPRLLSGLA